MRSNLIIGTSGHIDHGKTSLIQALCGVDLDSSPEERERGITISLGFTDLLLSSNRRVSFIDVPGHERLVRTMISGAMGMDAVLLCVSAVDGVMPQTKEHFSILKLLDLQHGVIALTMSDLVDEEMLELAQLDIEELIEGSFLEKAPIIQTCVGENQRGIEELKDAISAIPIRIHQNTGPFRLPIDRIFIRKGFGAVVTGTTQSGKITVGEDIDIVPSHFQAKIRGMQHHGISIQSCEVGQRVAINLSGLKPEFLHRGQVISRRGSIPPANILDAEYEHLAQAPNIRDGTRVRIMSGTTERLARLTIISDSEILEEGRYLIQLRTEAPMLLLPNDRFILQRESPISTLGGGRILDPWAKRTRKRDRQECASLLSKIAAGNQDLLLIRKKQEGASAQCAALWGSKSIELGERHYAPCVVSKLIDTLVSVLESWHIKNPLQLGIRAQELEHIHSVPLPSKSHQQLLKLALNEKRIIQHKKGLFALPNFEIVLEPKQEEECKRIISMIQAKAFEGMSLADLRDNPLVPFLIEEEKLFLIQTQIICATQINIIVEKLKGFFAKNEMLEPNDFKELTGLSRKYAIPMLEWFDFRGFTIRQGNKRKRR